MAYENKPLVKTNMAYGNKPFVKIKDGVKAPSGFHYMSNGKLMPDADHIAVSGYIEKKITGFNIDTKDINYLGESRSFLVRGDKGGIFSLEVYDDSGNYYNFTTRTWSSAKSRLNKIELSNNTYSSQITFTAVGGSLKTYTIDLYAEIGDNIKTSHVVLSEIRNVDDTVNLNKSTGSNSNLLRKVVYQDVKKNLYLSCVAPSLYAASADTVNGTVSSSNRIIIDGDATDPNVVQIGDKVTGTGIAASVHALVTKINPDNDNTHEIEISVADSIGDEVAITFTPPFNGMTPHGTDSTSGRGAIEISSGGSAKIGFSMTCTALPGRTFTVIRDPNTDDLCAYRTVNFASAALAISGEDTSSDSLFYRWPITNIANLEENMVLDTARSGTGVNTTTPATISKYLTTITETRVVENKYYTDIEEITINDVLVAGVDLYGNAITAVDRNGLITAQKGNIVFSKQQADALKSDSGVRIFGYGSKKIKALTGVEVVLSNINITPTQISTTTSSAVSASTTIPLAEVGNISSASEIRGIGIDSTVVNPTVTKKTAISGAGDIAASAVQTLESGQTLYFDNASNVLTITGTLEVTSMGINDTTLFLDVERFLKAV